MFNSLFILEHIFPGVGEMTRTAISAICAKDECKNWL